MTSENSHHEWVELLPECAAGRLSAFERASVEAHLASCADCREELEGWRAVAALLTEDGDAASDPTFEAGWDRLVAALPLREGVAASASTGTSRPAADMRCPRPLRTIEVGTLEDPDSPAVPMRPPRRATPVRERVRLALSVAAVLAIVGSFAALGVYHVASISRAPLPVGQWVRTSTPPAPTGLPSGALIADLTMVSAGEGWAVGSIVELDQQKGEYTVERGLILHYQDGRWNVSPDSPTGVQLLHFWTPAPGELWAWGRHPGQPNTIFFRYQDGRWQQAAPPTVLPARADGAHFVMTEISARTPDDVWVVGAFTGSDAGPAVTYVYDGSIFVRLSTGGLTLWHYDGSRWSAVSNLTNVSDVALAGPNEAWVIAQDSHLGGIKSPVVIAHVRGGSATVAVTPSGGEILSGLVDNSPEDAWATGEALPGRGLNTPVNYGGIPLYHYDGSSWTQVDPHAPADIYRTAVTGHGDVWGFARGEWQDPTFGPLPRVTQAFTYEDGRWQQAHWSIEQMRDVSNLTATPAGDVWAIGTYDIVWSRQNADGSVDDRDATGSVLLHYANGAWTQYGG
jgi:hypothetical protein